MNRTTLYIKLTQMWFLVFLIVGLSFLWIPNQVAEFLTSSAQLLGLKGQIRSAQGTVWYVLSLSLMSIVTMCAWFSSKNPHEPGVFISLVTAKLVSTFSFLGLASVYGSAWVLCAFGDGFVALTLLLLHPRSPKIKNLPMRFKRQFIGQAPYYEVWYGKIDIAHDQAFWFRYTLLNGDIQEATSWAILFNKGQIETAKESLPLQNLAPGNSIILSDTDSHRFAHYPQVFHLGPSRLDAAHAVGRAGNIQWDLNFEDKGLSAELIPASLQVLGLAKSSYSSCFLDLNFSGRIQTPQTELTVTNAKGMIGHIYGKRQAEEWAWVHCNSFENETDVVFEGLSARNKIAGKLTPPLSSFVLFVKGKRYSFSSFWKLTQATSQYEVGRWHFKTKQRGVTLEGSVQVINPQKIAVVQYTDTDGSNLWCHNSKLAELSLHLIDPKTQTDVHFNSKAQAAFEVVNRISVTALV